MIRASMPRFSVVVPTRDRPEFLDFCLAGLAAQTFEDVEVVVSDNAASRPAREVFDRWARPRWRYLPAGEDLPMHENFERGCAAATGELVAVVIDKTVLHPSALEVADRALAQEPLADIVTWWNEGYDPVDEDGRFAQGRFAAAAPAVAPASYDPAAELERHFSNAVRRGTDAVRYVRGKIVFGAYSRALIGRIRDRTGRLFYPLAPDYTAMVPACLLAKAAVDVGRPLLVSYNSQRSNGRLQSLDPRHARRFIEAADPKIVESLPIPGLYTSVHNVVAYDLVAAAGRCAPATTPPLDLGNLVRRAREDLALVTWSDAAERSAQYAILEAAEARLRVTPVASPRRSPGAVVGELLARVPAAERLAYRAAGRRPPPRGTYPSPVEAARAADRHYTALAAASR